MVSKKMQNYVKDGPENVACPTFRTLGPLCICGMAEATTNFKSGMKIDHKYVHETVSSVRSN